MNEPKFSDFYHPFSKNSKIKKNSRPMNFWEKASAAEFYVLDHPEALTLALHGRYLIYYRLMISGLKDSPVNGGWINIKNVDTVLDFINVKDFKRVHFMIQDTYIGDEYLKVITEVEAEAKSFSVDCSDRLPDFLGW
jgi:hypothetical protein